MQDLQAGQHSCVSLNNQAEGVFPLQTHFDSGESGRGMWYA